LQNAHYATVAVLAQKRMPSLSEGVYVAWVKASSLSENDAYLILISLFHL